VAELRLPEDVIAEIAARLDLREPNREAIQSLAAEVSQHYDVGEREPPFEAVIDSATGVGKTFVLAGAMELFAAANDVRDFVVVTPGRTILEKTRDNFTPGHPKSLLGPMSFRPVVITADNFATPAMRAAMDDGSQVKIYLFTVQSLIKPETKNARKAHKFQEGLGTEFYAHLQEVEDLVVFADEHHCYYGPAFSAAVRDLKPWVLVGLTATPHKNTPEDEIIFRYPLAAAIADKLVKTPVIVGRRDDRTDPTTKLTDGVTLLEAKQRSLDTYAKAHELEPIKPAMLVVAKDIEDADEYGRILRSDEFFAGAYADAVLVVHSKAPDEALADLAKVEEPESKVRVIISVGMLKEGWDVKNVYVIASMRSSVSEILTEQTLGRGMRLPFGAYTDVEIIDTLEVIAHERYEDLLKKAGVLNESFIDYRTRAALRVNAQGQTVVVSESVESGATPVIGTDGATTTVAGGGVGGAGIGTDGATTTVAGGGVGGAGIGSDGGTGVVGAEGGAVTVVDGVPAPAVTSVEQRTAQANQAAVKMRKEIERRPDAPTITIPVLRMTNVKSNFSLADIPTADSFRKLGAALAADPEGELRRILVGARVVIGPDGVKRTTLVRAEAADRIATQEKLFPVSDLRESLTDIILASPAVPARKEEQKAVKPFLDAFFDGLGEKAEAVLSANLGRAGARLIRLVEAEQKRYMAKPEIGEVVKLEELNPVRTTDKDTEKDRFGPFLKSLAYEGWSRSIFPVEWFDSAPERTVANMVDSDPAVKCWVRLQVKDLPILWNSGGQEYNPDLIVIDNDGTHWVVEVKMNKEMESENVQGKREAAQRWAKHVSSADEVKVPWRYLLVSEDDIKTSKDSWAALKKLGGA
jgi:type III restriction enzyme